MLLQFQRPSAIQQYRLQYRIFTTPVYTVLANVFVAAGTAILPPFGFADPGHLLLT